MPGVVVDGMDVIAVHEAVQAAVERARAGDGPSLVECKSYRYRAHSEGADIVHTAPRDPKEIEAWKKRDPILSFEKKLKDQDILSDADIKRIAREADAEMEEADRFALESPLPDPSIFDKVLYVD